MSHAIGSLVKCRGREWVVLPAAGDDQDLLLLRPLGGTDDEICGIYLPLELVAPASFDLPNPHDVGDHRSCRLLRDAVRLGFRASAGPFRSFARIACEPRPYQLVPLMMALRLDPIRLLIADDVGIGKSVEAALIARELLDRGEIDRLTVLCPPHLAEQWQTELREKFHVEAELVLASTISRLERQCGMSQSLFEVFPFTIVSTDYIKSSRRREEFLRTCPGLVIVDEAHTCATTQTKGGGRHHRNELLRAVAKDKNRHIILVTATPHSGIEAGFRSLLSLLDERFAVLPEDLSGKENESHRRQLAAHMIQRRRADIRHYLDADTPFPDREEKEETYKLHPEYRALFDKVLAYVRERVREAPGQTPKFRQRVRWWAALALLRTLASSPAAAAAALRSKAAGLQTEDEEEADDIGRRSVMDVDAEEEVDITDTVPGADADPAPTTDEPTSERRRLRDMAKLADGLRGEKDAKLKKLEAMTKSLLKDGFSPIIFCRFIATAEYIAQELRSRLKGVEVEWATGLLPPEEREQRVAELGRRRAEGSKIVLIATDCLSEGINLQAHFDAVIHYDLAWSPTRHEQRDGRVDRFGQPRKVVRSVMLYGTDNQIDGIVLDVLIRKHKTIRGRLGISVPVPINSNTVVEALFEGLLLREHQPGQLFFDEFMRSAAEEFHSEWENASEREKRSRTVFAQHTLKPDEVARELDEVRNTIGSAEIVSGFLKVAIESYGGALVQKLGFTLFDLRHAPRAVRDIAGADQFKAAFALPVDEGVLHLTRTHPLVEGLAAHVMDTALDPITEGIAQRCGVIHTASVEKRTTLLLLRLRYHIVSKRASGEESQLLAEDCRLVGFRGAPDKSEWLTDDAEIEKLLDAKPSGNIDKDRATGFIQKVLDGFDSLRPHLEAYAAQRGRQILDSHKRVREAIRQTGVRYEVEPQLPVDVLGIYVYLPA